ncbi:hypothetical protein Scep_003935 [Stephania cephalantha]|uniref:Uncharacterized protein n=1 Tax=Stephania cephalantha TaxID=152367 RepID=A0AAP0PYJ0_9MAGN
MTSRAAAPRAEKCGGKDRRSRRHRDAATPQRRRGNGPDGDDEPPVELTSGGGGGGARAAQAASGARRPTSESAWARDAMNGAVARYRSAPRMRDFDEITMTRWRDLGVVCRVRKSRREVRAGRQGPRPKSDVFHGHSSISPN